MGVATAYAAPIRDVLDKLGRGELSGPAGSWRAAGADLASAAHDQTNALGRARPAWEGHTADTAFAQTQELATATATLDANATAVATIVESAGAIVRAGRAQVQQILDSFLATAEPLLSIIPVPPLTATMLAGRAAADAFAATEVLTGVNAELSAESQALAGLPAVTPTAFATSPSAVENAPATATTPQHNVSGSPSPDGGPRAFSGTASAPGGTGAAGGPAAESATPTGTNGGSGGGSPGGSRSESSGGPGSGPALRPAIPPQPGTGVDVNLPGGATAQAPNPQAAAAVRNALSQLGVPYQWGGTTAGQGLDCSGLTSWAYGQAGVQIPRLAADQAIGASVSPDALLPGDLVVWSGHVAMVIGDGQMVEAGDPVQISPIRTSNQGDAFLGCYRPTG